MDLINVSIDCNGKSVYHTQNVYILSLHQMTEYTLNVHYNIP